MMMVFPVVKGDSFYLLRGYLARSGGNMLRHRLKF
jgi:hypothetical protein